MSANTGDLDALCRRAISLVDQSRKIVAHQINGVQIMTYYALGQWIVEEQQQGRPRANYGQQVIARLSEALTERFGKGFSVDTLENARKFYLTYQGRISEPAVRKFAEVKSAPVVRISGEMPFKLSWTHYLILMRMKNPQERDFYEREAVAQHWSKRELSRQYNSSLYERIMLNTDKGKALALAKTKTAQDDLGLGIKDPYVLEFLGLHEQADYTESELEARIIDHMQEFLMEMGRGFTFVGRQVRFTFDEDHFRIDLVLYNRLLRCFVLVDLKIGKLKHQDLGQMQMYVNYYDRYEKLPDENPTLGILLCADKNDRMVELTLPKDANIYASKYELVLPDKKLLQAKLQEWLEEDTEG